MTTPIKATVNNPAIHDEHILVVNRATLFGKTPAWNGLAAVDIEHYVQLIMQKKEFLPRSLMEVDPTYKQIIPYLIFQHEDKYFLMQRTATSTEKRLQNKYSLGIGGHIREEDMQTNSIIDWANREFHEEVDYQGALTIKPLGILNDDTNEVGKVHIGLVLLVQGNSEKIKVKSELKSGELLTVEQLKAYRENMESWSQYVFDFLK